MMNRPERRWAIDFHLLCGERGAGKSSLCQQILATREGSGLPSGGVICPGSFSDSGHKTGCMARLAALPSGDQGSCFELGTNERRLNGPSWRLWSFSAAGFVRANGAFIANLETFLSTAGDSSQEPGGAGLVFLDEVGPLETVLGQGFQPSIDRLDSLIDLSASTDQSAIAERLSSAELCTRLSLPLPRVTVLCTVRPELLDQLLARWPVDAVTSLG